LRISPMRQLRSPYYHVGTNDRQQARSKMEEEGHGRQRKQQGRII
jgi:hypothetical protein